MTEQPFEFSSLPARWGPSIGAAVLTITLLLAHLMTSHALPRTALTLMILVAVALQVAGSWVMRQGLTKLPWGRISSANLVATPRASVQPPEIWLVAHIDSKSQTIPMLVRIASVGISVLLYVITLGMLVAIVAMDLAGAVTPLGPHENPVMAVPWMTAFIGAVATIPLVVCFIGNKSQGAVDNASGVAAVTLAVELLRDRERVGVIITSGEELGLAGARAFVSEMPLKGVALNCDTVDDCGWFICLNSGRLPERLSEALARAAERTGIAVSRRGVLPGVLADNIAFTSAGWESFTLGRGNLGTLARVHTSRDRPEEIEGTGIAMAAQLLAATAEELF